MTPLPATCQKAKVTRGIRDRLEHISRNLASPQDGQDNWAVPCWLVDVMKRVRDRLENLRRHHNEETDYACALARELTIRSYLQLFFGLHEDLDKLSLVNSHLVMPWLRRQVEEARRESASIRVRELVAAIEAFKKPSNPDAERLHELKAWCLYELKPEHVASCQLDLLQVIRTARKMVRDMDATTRFQEWFISAYDVDRSDEELGSGSLATAYVGAWMSSTVVIRQELDKDSVDAPSQDSWISLASDAKHEPRAERARNVDVVVKDAAAKEAAVVREADLWFRLRYPLIVRLFGACHVRHRFFICKYAPLGSLSDYFWKRYFGPNMPKEDMLTAWPLVYKSARPEIWSMLYETALALRYLHRRGIATEI